MGRSWGRYPVLWGAALWLAGGAGLAYLGAAGLRLPDLGPVLAWLLLPAALSGGLAGAARPLGWRRAALGCAGGLWLLLALVLFWLLPELCTWPLLLLLALAQLAAALPAAVLAAGLVRARRQLAEAGKQAENEKN